MPILKRNLKIFLPVIIMVFSNACATVPQAPVAEQSVVSVVQDAGTIIGRYAPLFLIENNAAAYNRIGTPQASVADDGQETITVDPDRATFYVRQQAFTTPGGTYTNLIYRVHFSEVPGGWAPFHLTAGKNVGLLVIITLNNRHQPLLVTTVHTCGCYLAFIPTAYLPMDAWPAGWQKARQAIYGEELPGFLDTNSGPPERTRPAIVLRDRTHRVKDIRWAGAGVPENVSAIAAVLQPLEALERLPLEMGGVSSFYETAGSRRGYVKESYKLRERLFMSWWALAWRWGEDENHW